MRALGRLWKWLVTPQPRCSAILESGHQCFKEPGHQPTYHEADVNPGAPFGSGQHFVWEDPACGVHPVGFYRGCRSR
jgi:hypothetical protein